jgi:hydroxyacylglutathione hydrolase
MFPFSYDNQHHAKESMIFGKNHKKIRSLSLNEVNDLMNAGALILDTRSKEAFSSAHIPNSINIPFAPTLANWAEWVLPSDRSLVLVLEKPNHLDDVVIQLARIGYDRIDGFLKDGDISAWETAHIDALSVQEIAHLIQQNKAPFILDVRTEDEWRNGHIEGAHHSPLGSPANAIDDIPRNTPIALICASGYRASISASLLKRMGFLIVANIVGGMTAWHHEGFPVVK